MTEATTKKLSFWTLFKVWFLSTTFLPNFITYPRMYGTGFTAGMLPALKKLYADKPEELKDAMVAYNEAYYLAEPMISAGVTAIVLRMEEQRAAGEDIPRSTMVGFKTGVMGGMTGLGDTIFTSTLRPLAMALFTPLAISGNILGPIGFFLFKTIARYAVGIVSFVSCYKFGKDALTALMQKGTGVMQKAMQFVAILSMFIMGAMVSKYVTPSIALSWTAGETTVKLQDFLNSALPGLLPLGTVFATYGLMKKNWNIIMIIGLFLGICVAGSLVGVFA